MPQAKYEPIYKDLRNAITDGIYKSGDFLPSEHELVARYGCARNTVRRAISMLTNEGYLLPQHGRGVQVIYRNITEHSLFTIGGIESFAEAARRHNLQTETRILAFKEITADETISMKTGFDTGENLFYIERLRLFNGNAYIFDTNIFLASETPGLTPEIASVSVYRYLEDTLGMNITTSRRIVTAEQATKKDRRLLDLGSLDFVLVVSGQVFNSKGVMFEYTQSRHVPDQVSFVESAVRQKV